MDTEGKPRPRRGNAFHHRLGVDIVRGGDKVMHHVPDGSRTFDREVDGTLELRRERIPLDNGDRPVREARVEGRLTGPA